MSVFSNLTSEQLRKAADIKEQIRKLEKALAALAGGTASVTLADNGSVLSRKKKRKFSAAGIARIKAAQKLRWAKFKQQSSGGQSTTLAKKKRFTMSDAARAKISEAAKLRWARVRAAQAA